MTSERSRTLHNFSLPPRLNWGVQRHLRCTNLTPTSLNDAVYTPDRKRPRTASFRSPTSSSSIHHENDDNQIEVVREKLVLDLRSEVDKFSAAFLRNSEIPPPPVPESRPWNLRTRRSPATIEIPVTPVVPNVKMNEKRAKFSVALSRHEIEEDFIGMTGRRPPRKPKKRPRYIQKQLDVSFFWVNSIYCFFFFLRENLNFFLLGGFRRCFFLGYGYRKFLLICIKLMRILTLILRYEFCLIKNFNFV